MAQLSAQVAWNGPEILAAVHAAARRGLATGAEYILEGARGTVPHDEGTLERSGAATVDDIRLTAAVSFDTPYAVIQHENPHFRHAPGRGWKYLENAMNARGADALALTAAAIRRAAR